MGRIASFHDLGCLVTGASSGIGRDIALLLAERGARLMVTARREERLTALAGELRARGALAAWPLPLDLGAPGAAERLAHLATSHLGAVDVLVNNAGFAVPGSFHQCDLARTLAMLQVNVTAAVELTRRLLPGMVARDRGGVLTVASMAAYYTAPYQSAYAGTKAFLLNWSAGLHQELKRTNLAITALCPGMTDTEFFAAAGYPRGGAMLSLLAPSLPVARKGLAALARGQMEVVPGPLNKTLLAVARCVPRTVAAAVARRLLARRPKK